MKRTLFSFVLWSLAVGTIAATSPLPREVRDVLERAVVNERQASARYEVFARKAEEEGYRGAAALFRAQAQAERIHGERFAAVLRDHEITPPAAESFSPVAGGTAENLRTAAASENAERDGAYREAIEMCNRYGAPEMAKVFDQTRDSEVEHSNLCVAASRDLDSMKAPKAFYVCGKCGYTTDVKLSFCPACQHRVPPTAVE